MVDKILIAISCISLLAWFIQEKFARASLQSNLNALIDKKQSLTSDQLQDEIMPAWNDVLFKVVAVIWIAWAISVVMVKDGDFAFVLVMLTLFSGLICGLDVILFSKARTAYADSKAVIDFLAKYTEEQRQSLSLYIREDMIVGEYAKSFFPVLALVLLLRSFVIEPFQIPSGSMVPTLLVGDYILVNKYTYGLRLPVVGTKVVEIGEPQRGDVMVFFPPDKDIYFIKRVIGLPGDTVSYKNKVLSVNGKQVSQTLLAELPPIRPIVELMSEDLAGVDHLIHKNKRAVRNDDFSITVKPGHYWMMGDNRDNSSDSRVWGQVPEDRIVGKAFARWLHWPTFTDVPTFSRAGSIY